MDAPVSPALVQVFRSVGRDLFLQGLNSSHSGNLSARDGRTLWLTRRGAPLGRLKVDDLIPVSLDHPEPMASAASSEFPAHRSICGNERAQAVVHAHPPATIALSFSRSRIEPVDMEGIHYFSRVQVIETPTPYDPQEAAEPISRALQEAKIVVVRGHGSFSWGADLWEAYHWVSALEHSCRILLLSLLDRA